MSLRIELPCEVLHRLYINEGLSQARVAALLGCSAATVANRLRGCGIRARDGRFKARPLPRAELEALYSDELLPMAAIAARLGVSIGTVHNWRRAYGIPARARRGQPR
ncbi:MAG TPA: helix-turn-helix domain-containing protein [Chloroflexaceae bacterium]|nr:helix-turn-helix domain-containing protein [Chloroflexaceae bacterium]